MREEEIIELFTKGVKSPPGYLGVGDDAALFPAPGGKRWVLTTDSMIEGVHFRMDWSTPEQVAIKFFESNLSDLAAMGASPKMLFLSVALSKKVKEAWLFSFKQKLASLMKKHNVILMGGNTSSSKAGVFIDASLIGVVEQGKALLRSKAKPGDLLCVTRNLGDSRGGLRLLKSMRRSRSTDTMKLIKRHLEPKAQLKLGLWLAWQKQVKAAMDISDGLYEDVQKLCRRSGVGAQIWMDQLPVSSELKNMADKKKWPLFDMALTSGEEYTLLFCLRQKDFESIKGRLKKSLRLPLFAVGEIQKGRQIELLSDGKKRSPKMKSFCHFEI